MTLFTVISRRRAARAALADGPPAPRRRRWTRRAVVCLAAVSCAFAQHSLSVLDVHAALVAATTSVSQQDGGTPSDPLPAIVCDVPNVGDAVGGDAIVTTAIACSGPEDQIYVTATWTDMTTGQILSSDSQTITSPTTNYERQDSMGRGVPGQREFQFCFSLSAIGFQPYPYTCNQALTGL